MGFIKTDDQEAEVLPQEGEEFPKLHDAAEQLGVPFACQSGDCGTCEVEVVEGMENLTELTEPEKEKGCGEGEQKDHRLMCQCRLKQGDVKIKLPF